MNHAIFAIPGLMPPRAVHFRKHITSPEDGSLRMLIHCGNVKDTVNYTLDLPGWRMGRVKDPSYDFTNEDLERAWGRNWNTKKARKNWPQFMYVSTFLPKDVIIPVREIAGCPVPIVELNKADKKDTRYWYLDLPKRVLPYGDTRVEVIVNGRKHVYVVSRPRFSIHKPNWWMRSLKRFVNQEGESVDLAFKQFEKNVALVNLERLKAWKEGEITATTEFQGVATINNVDYPLTVVLDGHELSITFPEDAPVGHGTWKVEYRNVPPPVEDDRDEEDEEIPWTLLVCGDLVMEGTQWEEPDAYVVFTVTVGEDGEITLPIAPYGEEGTYTIDWGDGILALNKTAERPTHTYGEEGTHVIKVSGDISLLQVNDLKLTSLELVGDSTIKAIAPAAFKGCASLTSIPGKLFTGLSELPNCAELFANCAAINEIPEDFWSPFEEITSLSAKGIFSGCTSLAEIPDNFMDPIADNGEVDMRDAFKGCAGFKGDLPTYWETYSNIQHKGFFDDCNNAKNFEEVPDDWGSKNRMIFTVRAPVPGHQVYLGTYSEIQKNQQGHSIGTYSYAFNWGDGSSDDSMTNWSGFHTYSEKGDYSAVLTGDVILTGNKSYWQPSTWNYSGVMTIESMGTSPVRWYSSASCGLSYECYSGFYSTASVTTFKGAFLNGLDTENFSIKNLSLKKFFYSCHLGEVPSNFFAGLPEGLSTLDCTEMFAQCNQLRSAPSNFFAGLPEGLSTLDCTEMFAQCNQLRSAPSNFFAGLPEGLSTLDCTEMFYSCNWVTTAPDNFFSGLPGTLRNLDCTGMFIGKCFSNIQDNFFAGLPDSLESFSGTYMFYSCTYNGPSGYPKYSALEASYSISQMPTTLFPHVPSRLNHINLTGMFGNRLDKYFAKYQATYTGSVMPSINFLDGLPDEASTVLTGMYSGTSGQTDTTPVPEFWKSFSNTKHDHFFTNVIGVSNYSDIPSDWK